MWEYISNMNKNKSKITYEDLNAKTQSIPIYFYQFEILVIKAAEIIFKKKIIRNMT